MIACGESEDGLISSIAPDGADKVGSRPSPLRGDVNTTLFVFGTDLSRDEVNAHYTEALTRRGYTSSESNGRLFFFDNSTCVELAYSAEAAAYVLSDSEATRLAPYSLAYYLSFTDPCEGA